MNLKEVLFWLFLFISVVLLIWILVGDSPSELIFIVTIFISLFLKVWSVSDRQIRSEGKIGRINDSMIRMGDGISKIDDNVSRIENNIKIISNDFKDMKDSIVK